MRALVVAVLLVGCGPAPTDPLEPDAPLPMASDRHRHGAPVVAGLPEAPDHGVPVPNPTAGQPSASGAIPCATTGAWQPGIDYRPLDRVVAGTPLHLYECGAGAMAVAPWSCGDPLYVPGGTGPWRQAWGDLGACASP